MVAEHILKQILNRVAYIESKRLQAIDMMMERPLQASSAYHRQPDLQALEHNAQHWRFLVPTDPTTKAHLIRQLCDSFSFDPAQSPRIATMLEINEQAVQSAYQQHYSQPVQDAFTQATLTLEAQAAQPADELLQALEWRFLRRGEVLYQQGDTSDALYGVVDGRLRAIMNDSPQNKLAVEIHKGELIGEEAIMSDAKRTATVVAVRDTDLVFLTPQNYEQLVIKYPRSMSRLGMQLIRKMQRLAGVTSAPPSSKSVVILPSSDEIGDFGQRLATTLGQALYLHPSQLQDVMPEKMATAIEDVVTHYDFVDWLQAQEREHSYLIFHGAAAFPKWTLRALEQADYILIVGKANDSPALSAVEQLLEQVSQPELLPSIDLVLLHPKRTTQFSSTGAWLETRNVHRHHHLALNEPHGFERIARFLSDKAIGFVFGGGGMRAAAHIGAIKALREAGYYPDVAGGTSSGSIVAAMVAMDWDIETITELARDKLLRRDVLVSLTIPIVSISSAHRLNKAYTSIFGDVRTEDLWTTCYTISANVTQTTQSVNHTGLLRRAVRASTSIAGMFPPAPDENGDIHIDGGVVNNTPADVMRRFIGNGINIAVDLGFTEREKINYTYGDSLSGFYVLWRRFNPFIKPLRAPNIMSLLMRSNAIGSINITHEQMSHADLLIQPAVAGYGLFDFDQFDRLFELGYEAAQTGIAEFEQTRRDT